MGATPKQWFTGEETPGQREERHKAFAEDKSLLLDPLTNAAQSLDRMRESAYANNDNFSGLAPNSQYTDAQSQALGNLENIVNSGGLTNADKATIQQQRLASEGQERGSREALANQMQARGMGGSGLAAMSAISNAQAGSQTRAQNDMAEMQLAQQRKDAAIQALGNMSTNMRGEDYNEQLGRAQGMEGHDQFNASQSLGLIGAYNRLAEAQSNAGGQLAAMGLNRSTQNKPGWQTLVNAGIDAAQIGFGKPPSEDL